MAKYKFNDYTFKWERDKSKFKKFISKLTPFWWDNFWYDYHWNGIIGPGSSGSRTFKEGRLALVLSIIGTIVLLGILIF